MTLAEADLSNILELVGSVSAERRQQMSEHARWLYGHYFSTIEKITLTTLDIINDRVFPQNAKVYEDWNNPLNPVSFNFFNKIYCVFSNHDHFIELRVRILLTLDH